MRNSLLKLYNLLSTDKYVNFILIALVSAGVIVTTHIIRSLSDIDIHPSAPTKILSLILLDLVILLFILLLLLRRTLSYLFKDYNQSRLRSRIILMFSLVAVIPTIIISTFSLIIFNYGVQGWFDSKVSTAINQSMRVADLYIEENKLQLRNTAISVASDLNDLYFELIQNPELLERILNAQAQARSLTEAIIYQKSTNKVLAQSVLSFSLSFWIIPNNIYERADSGEVVEVLSDPGKLRMLIRLSEFDDTYLLVGKLVDEEIINYVDKTSGAANSYKFMMKRMSSLQIKFAILFILISGILLISTIIVGAIFANKIARPIRRLVKATELVQSGDLTVQVAIEEEKEDELVILSNAFNKMIKKIDIQQKDLALAQRAIAWSDVARRVAHEIKNPLTPISLSADRLARKFIDEIKDKEDFKKYIDTIRRHTKDIQKIITDFAEFARMPAPNFEFCDIVKLLKELTESRQIINDKIEYKFATNIEKLDFVCDTTQINQVIVNLFKNAEEALEGLTIDKIITLQVIMAEEEMEIIIRDNGKGFPLDLIDKVTDAYITTRSKGTGLGLSIVKKIVQDHGGEIIISNIKENSGGEVKISFDKKYLTSKVKN